MAVPLGDRQQVPGGAPLAAPRHATKAVYQAPDLSRDCLSELYRELEDLFGTTAPEPLDMSDQAFADVLKSIDECLRTGDEASEAEVEGDNHPAPEGGSTPGTTEPKPPHARMASFKPPPGAACRTALPKTPAGEVRHTGWRARIHTPRRKSPHVSYSVVPSKEFMNDKLARGVWFPEAEGCSDSSDTSEEDDASYVPPTAPCPKCAAPEPCPGRPWRRRLTAVGNGVGVRDLLPIHLQFLDDRVGMRVRCHGGQLRHDVEETRLDRKHLNGTITGWAVVPGPTGRGPPVATDGWESVVYTVKLKNAQEGGGLRRQGRMQKRRGAVRLLVAHRLTVSWLPLAASLGAPCGGRAPARRGRGHRDRCRRRRCEPVVELILVAPMSMEACGHLSDVTRGEGP